MMNLQYMQKFLLIAYLLLISSACVEAGGDGVDNQVSCSDFDGDSYGEGCEPGPDCDDADFSIFENCVEENSCIDSDGDGYGTGCDAGADCNDSNPDLNSDCYTPVCIDEDLDGYGYGCDSGYDCDDSDANYNTDCSAQNDCIDNDGDDYGENCPAGNDCDDTNPAIREDCDCIDADHDHYGEGCSLGEDCDDTDRFIIFNCDCVDVDGDGHGIDCRWGPDCDDFDSSQYENCICTDEDADGFGRGCAAGPDCNDTDASVHEGCPCVDYDNDGFFTAGCPTRLLVDCNDFNEDINPFGWDEHRDGIDSDCDGIEDGTGCEGDLDGDGYGSGAGCINLDCDETDEWIYFDRWGNDPVGDGIDENCDGIDGEWSDGFDDSDNDGDGVQADRADCDDNDSLISPLVAEQADMIDNDCDGIVDEPEHRLTREVLEYNRCLSPIMIGQYIYCSDSYNLLVFDASSISGPTKVNQLEIGRDFTLRAKIGGALIGGVAEGVYNYDEKMISFSLVDPENPIIQAELKMSDHDFSWHSRTVAHGNKLYLTGYSLVAGNSGGAFAIVDCTDPSSPVFEGAVLSQTNQQNMSIFFVDNYLYYSSWISREGRYVLEIYQLSSESLPEFITLFDLDPEGTPSPVAAGDNLLVLEEWGIEEYQLHILTLDDPLNPVTATTIHTGEDIYSNPVLVGNKLYYMTAPTEPVDDLSPLSMTTTIHLVDLTNPELPEEIASLSGLTASTMTLIGDDLIYLPNEDPDEESSIVDFSTPASPVVYNFPAADRKYQYFNLEDDQLLFDSMNSWSDNDLTLFDLSDPLVPVSFGESINFTYSFYWANRLSRDGAKLAQATSHYDSANQSWLCGIDLLSIDVSGITYETTTDLIDGACQSLDISGNLVALATKDKLAVYSIEDISLPVLKSINEITDFYMPGEYDYDSYKIKWIGDHLYFFGLRGIMILDYSNSEQPVLVNIVNHWEAYPEYVVSDGSNLILLDYHWSDGTLFYTIDVSDPALPSIAGMVYQPLAIQGTPYMADGILIYPTINDKATVIDYSDINNPVHVGMISAPGEIGWAGIVAGGYIAEANGYIYIEE